MEVSEEKFLYYVGEEWMEKREMENSIVSSQLQFELGTSYEERHDKLTAFKLHLKQESGYTDVSVPTVNYLKRFSNNSTTRSSTSKSRTYNSNKFAADYRRSGPSFNNGKSIRVEMLMRGMIDPTMPKIIWKKSEPIVMTMFIDKARVEEEFSLGEQNPYIRRYYSNSTWD
ncbi:hypothetical protein COLO4_22646 [Corchorus olitorius]|uniref:Uncharacterized protein n=1 Tax=Corchorus olitorius TaxID=93759 RepID=A0A1R3IKP7_9ROSI|nr:hypothetical protein COLO4_22646 [Corchorus olitorius]